MKKLLLAMLFAGALLTGCSSDETVSTPGNPGEISFRASANKLSRSEVNTANLDNFNVWGYNHDKTAGSTYQGALVFNGTHVIRSGQAGQYLWTYTPMVYWIKNSDYVFSALNQGTLTFPTPLTGNGTTEFENTDGESDLVWATQVASTGNDPTVQPGTVDLSFRHALCRVMFKFYWDDPNHDYSIKIKGLDLAGTAKKGVFTLGQSHISAPTPGTWGNFSDIFTANYTFGDNANRTSDYARFDTDNTVLVPATSEYLYLIPGDHTGANNKLSASFTVTLYQAVNGNPVPQRDYAHTGAKAHPISATFQPGHSYVIMTTLTATGGDPDDPKPTIDPDNTLYPIQFTVVDVTDWDEGEQPADVPHPVNY